MNSVYRSVDNGSLLNCLFENTPQILTSGFETNININFVNMNAFL